jgi:hypothetical protein
MADTALGAFIGAAGSAGGGGAVSPNGFLHVRSTITVIRLIRVRLSSEAGSYVDTLLQPADVGVSDGD